MCLFFGDLINAYKYLQGAGQEDGARLFPVVPSDRTRGNGHKLEQRKLQLNVRKNFFPLRVTEPWPRLPRGAVESPSLEIFKTCLDKVLCSLLWVTLLGQGVGLGDPQRSLPTPNILWFKLAVMKIQPALLHFVGMTLSKFLLREMGHLVLLNSPRGFLNSFGSPARLGMCINVNHSHGGWLYGVWIKKVLSFASSSEYWLASRRADAVAEHRGAESPR